MQRSRNPPSRYRKICTLWRLAVGVVILIVLVAVLVLLIRSRRQLGHSPSTASNAPATSQTLPQPAVALSPDLMLGNPSDADTDPSHRRNYLMIKKFYALSYNDSKGTPNWVSWRVTSANLGDAPRKRIFDPDDTLPVGFYRVLNRDYSGCGYDRGHMCPHSDRAANEEMSFATFVLTNIIPQAASVNQKAWARLEDYCRVLVRENNHLYVIAGPFGQGGVGKLGPSSTIANGRVVVPAECWKVIVVVPESPGDDLPKIRGSTRVIAVIMPNVESVGEDWFPYLTNIATIEKKTGFHLLGNVPTDVAAVLRLKIDHGGSR